MVKSIAIVGPGAIGGMVAAWLDRDPDHDVTLCARTRFERLSIATPDAGTLTATPRLLDDPAAATPVDWAIVATKAYDVAGASAWLERLVGPDTRVAILQNGVEQVSRFSQRVSVERLLPAVVDIPAERTEPGRITQRRNGTIVVPAGEVGEAFVRLFAATPIAVSTSDDFVTVAWTKLALNAAGAVSALTLKPGGVAHREPIAEIMRALVHEVVAVGRAEGAALEPSLADEVVGRYRAGPRDAVNSLHADRAAGRPMESDARNGVVVRLGLAHGIATPVNAMIVALLDAAAAA